MLLMGLSFAKITLSNPKVPQHCLETEALADTGALFLIIPEAVREQLNLSVESEKRVVLADGTHRDVPYVGPIELRFNNRSAFVGAVVMGEQVLLGAIPMEDMDFVVSPVNRRVDINPDHPHRGVGFAKQTTLN
jgi:clan AA aspartic protease